MARIDGPAPFSPLGVTESFPQQEQLLRLAERDTGDEINTFHGVAGRGGGKTIALVLLVWASCVLAPEHGGNRGLKHCITAPTYGMIDRFIIPTWRAVVKEFDAVKGELVKDISEKLHVYKIGWHHYD